jgi:hypothetical protein
MRKSHHIVDEVPEVTDTLKDAERTSGESGVGFGMIGRNPKQSAISILQKRS